MPSPIKFQSIDHITLIVSDLDQTRRFYCDCLGMQEVDRPDFDFPGIWLTAPQASGEARGFLQAMIHITLADQNSGLAGWGDRQVKRVSRGHHFAFEVTDANQAYQHLAKLGVNISAAPKKRPDGAAQFYVEDPDGHLIEFFSRPAADSGPDIL